VIDASVAMKWFFNEEDSDKASFFLKALRHEEIKIVVPEIFYLETANACRKRVKQKKISIDTAIQTHNEMMSLPLERYPDYELAGVAWTNSLQYDLSVYDALYLSLAEVYAAPLITADRTLLKICRNRFDFIEDLREVDKILI